MIEGIEYHFQANQLLFISVYQCNVRLRSQKYGGGAFAPKIVGGAFAPEILGGGHVPPFPPLNTPLLIIHHNI